MVHSLTVSSKLGLLLPIVARPVSYRPTLVVARRLFPLLSEFSWLPPGPASMSPTVIGTLNDRTLEAGTAESAGP